MTSRQAELIGWAMSACSLTRPSASRVARSSSSLCPHRLQNRARRWFLQPHEVQRSVSLRLGIATDEPLVPSMIFRSRTTKASSNVTEQKACRRSFSLLSSISLIRTSVMTTSVLLLTVAHSIATPNDTDTRPPSDLPSGMQGPCKARGVGGVMAQCEHRAAAAAHQGPRRLALGQPTAPLRHGRLQLLGGFLQPVEEQPAHRI